MASPAFESVRWSFESVRWSFESARCSSSVAAGRGTRAVLVAAEMG